MIFSPTGSGSGRQPARLAGPCHLTWGQGWGDGPEDIKGASFSSENIGKPGVLGLIFCSAKSPHPPDIADDLTFYNLGRLIIDRPAIWASHQPSEDD